ncbi:hypothetical protein [Paraburkholderia sp. J10-1]|uniref:hypothetical protein n=1 Tax=Paraburkholderia sp. J10-1 TaxID=2805430 RepID=UPI002AB75B62|nr:hypothetical protein [Paraburkholderia sp. J10-1]
MAEREHNAGSLTCKRGAGERVEIWRDDDDDDLTEAEPRVVKYATLKYLSPDSVLPKHPARILAPEEMPARRDSFLSGAVQYDRDLDATYTAERLRRAVETAVLAGRLTPRYEDGTKMDGMPLRWPFAPFVRVFFERVEFQAFMRDEVLDRKESVPEVASTIAGGSVDPAETLTLDAPASIDIPPMLMQRKGGKLAAKWVDAERAALVAWRNFLAAQSDGDPVGTISAALQVSREAVRKHLEKPKSGKAKTRSTRVIDGKRQED